MPHHCLTAEKNQNAKLLHQQQQQQQDLFIEEQKNQSKCSVRLSRFVLFVFVFLKSYQ